MRTPVPYDSEALRRELIRDEGQRLTPYRDSLGNWTVGVGHLLVGNELLEFVDVALGKAKKTLSETGCAELLVGDILAAENVLDRIFRPFWRTLDDVRQRALLNLAFNLGNRLATFQHFRQCVEHEAWYGAAQALENSLWFKQVKSRGPRIVHMIRAGIAQE